MLDATVLIGNFDGPHRGHKALVQAARKLPKKRQRPVVLLTFSPHPRRFFAPETPPFQLSTHKQRASRLARLGLDASIVLPFDATLAKTEWDAFVQTTLVEDLQAHTVLVGENFRFGHMQKGTAEKLRTLGKSLGNSLGFQVIFAPLCADSTGQVISSGRIRTCLATGDVEKARTLLGHPYTITGTVIQGQKLGQKLGFPTANLLLGEFCPPAHASYATMVTLPNQKSYPAAAYFGSRPAVQQGVPMLEVHLLDYAGDLYGQEISVAFFANLGKEDVRVSRTELAERIQSDCEKTKAFFATQKG